MQEEQRRAASGFLLSHWREGRHTQHIPAELRPTTRAEAYGIQAMVEQSSARPLVGWKIAATSVAGQKHINVDGPLAGRLLAERIIPEGAPVSLGSNRMLVAEIEFVFRMGKTLWSREKAYSEEEMLDAVAALHLGIEIPDSRFLAFETVGEAQLIADNACADQFVLGRQAPDIWRNSDLSSHKVLGLSSRGFVHEGCGANVLGGPLVALTWLGNELSQHGIALAEDQIVTTGTCCVPIPISPGDVVTGDYGSLGEIQVSFTQ
jgi:2-keto-4-pentenoate hydratase